MNYLAIHDKIIKRGLLREYDSSKYQNHHIIPLHENKSSIDLVPLTIKEHRIIHFIRYKLGYGVGNYKAYLLLKGVSDIETHLIITKKAGKTGGKVTRKNKSGIFSEFWDRSKEMKTRHATGIIRVDSFVAKELGKLSAKSGKGIHNNNWNFSKQTKKNWENRVYDEHFFKNLKSGEFGKKYGGIGGNTCVKNEIGIHNPQKRKEYASLGGKVSGKLPHWTNGTENKKSENSPGEGWYRGRTLKHYKTRGN